MIAKLLFMSALVGQALSFKKIYLFHILLLISGFKNIRIGNALDFLTKNKLLVFLVFYSCLSLYWTPAKTEGYRDVLVLMFGVAFYYLIDISSLKECDLIKMLKVISWANLFLSVLEAFEILRFPNSFYSELAPLFGKPYGGFPGTETVPTGFYFNPNNNAFFILMFTPLIVVNSSLKSTLFYLCVSSFVVFMAASKLVLIGWILLLFVLSGFLIRKKLGIMKSTLALLFLLSLTGACLKFSNDFRVEKYSKAIPSIIAFAKEAPQNFFLRLLGHDVYFDYSKVDMSLHERLIFVDGLAEILNDHWIFGRGAGSLIVYTAEQAGRKMNLKTPHFYFMEIAAKYGIFFLFFYLYWIYSIAKPAIFRNKYYGLALVLFLIFNAVMSSAYYFLPMWAFFIILKKKGEEINKHSC